MPADGDSVGLNRIRRAYLPLAGIRVLLVGESPPPGRGFFYTADSTLYHQTHRVFIEHCGASDGADKFLREFADAGFYLADLSDVRGDKPHLRPKSPDVREAVRSIAALIGQDTVAVIGVLREIDDLVASVVAASPNRDIRVESLPFPFHRSEQLQGRFRSGLRDVLEEVGCR